MNIVFIKLGLVWFDSFYFRVSTITAIKSISHKFESTLTDGTRFTAAGLPWWSPIQVLAYLVTIARRAR